MKIQKEFREIIAPALLICIRVLKAIMIIGKHPLYIDTDTFNKYGGVHILLDVLVSNTSEIGISLFSDYEVSDILYHIDKVN